MVPPLFSPFLLPLCFSLRCHADCLRRFYAFSPPFFTLLMMLMPLFRHFAITPFFHATPLLLIRHVFLLRAFSPFVATAAAFSDDADAAAAYDTLASIIAAIRLSPYATTLRRCLFFRLLTLRYDALRALLLFRYALLGRPCYDAAFDVTQHMSHQHAAILEFTLSRLFSLPRRLLLLSIFSLRRFLRCCCC